MDKISETIKANPKTSNKEKQNTKIETQKQPLSKETRGKPEPKAKALRSEMLSGLAPLRVARYTVLEPLSEKGRKRDKKQNNTTRQEKEDMRKNARGRWETRTTTTKRNAATTKPTQQQQQQKAKEEMKEKTKQTH